MKNILLIISLIFFTFYLKAQVKTVPTKFDPIVELNLPGTTIIGSPSIVGKEVTITDVDDATNMTILIRTPSSDTSSNPTYPNLLTLGSVFKVNIQNVTSGDTVFIREDGLGVNGIVGSPGYAITSNQKTEFIYTTTGWIQRTNLPEVAVYLSSYSEMSNRSFSANQTVIVKTSNVESRYKIKNDSVVNIVVDATNGILSTANGKFAHLQPKDDYIDACDFGALPASISSAGDAAKINQAIRYAIYAEFPVVSFSLTGEYDIEETIMILKDEQNDQQYDFVELTLKGPAPTYGIGGDNNFVSFDHNLYNAPCIVIQRARQTEIRNINLIGNLPSEGFEDLIWQESMSQRLNLSGHRSNRYSPHAGIVIDPFDDKVGVVTSGGASDQYPTLTQYYGQTTDGGSSHITLNGLAVRGFGIGIAHNPSVDIQNGDNVKFEYSTIENCFAAFSTGQGQSKGNTFNNIYSLGGINVLIDCKQIGLGLGAPPFVSDCNIAGSVARVVDAETINTSFLYIRSSFMESVASIGKSGITTLIEGCRFSFAPHSSRNIPGSNHIWLQSSNNATFKNCDFVYFSNGGYQMPFNFIENNSSNIKIEDCYFDGGRPISHAYAGTIGTGGTTIYTDKLTIDNCTKVEEGGAEILLTDYGTQYSKSYLQADNVNGGTVSWETIRVPLNSPWPTRSNPNTNYQMTLSRTGAANYFQKNDIIVMASSGVQSDPSMLMGFVEQVNTNDILIYGIPFNYMDARNQGDTVNAFILRPRRNIDRVFGDLTSGNDTIKNIYNISQLKVGDRIRTPSGNIYDQVNAFSRIKEINSGEGWAIVGPFAPTGNENKALIQDKVYKKRRNVNNTDDRFGDQSILKGWYVGDEMLLSDKDTSILICTKSGVYGTDWEPEFSPIVSQSYADLNLLEYTGGTIPGGRMIEPLTLEGSLVMEEDNSLIRFEKDDNTLIGSLGASISGGIGLLQWGEWFLVSKGSIHAGISDFQDSTTFNNTSDPNARVIVNIPMEIDNGQDIVDESDQEFKVPFGRDKGQETDVNLNLGSVLARSGHMSFEYTSRVTSGAVANNVIWIDTLGQNIKHMLDIYITAIDESATYNVKVRTAGVDSIFIRDTLVSEYILQDDQTLHIKSIKTGGNNVYKIINPEKKGSYTNSSGSNQTVITITHNLGVTPNIIYITPTTDVGTWYVSNKNPTEIEITMSTGLANTASLQWFVDR